MCDPVSIHGSTTDENPSLHLLLPISLRHPTSMSDPHSTSLHCAHPSAKARPLPHMVTTQALVPTSCHTFRSAHPKDMPAPAGGPMAESPGTALTGHKLHPQVEGRTRSRQLSRHHQQPSDPRLGARAEGGLERPKLSMSAGRPEQTQGEAGMCPKQPAIPTPDGKTGHLTLGRAATHQDAHKARPELRVSPR